MDKQLVIVVPTEVNAYQVLRALEALDDQGSIVLYASTVVTKTPEGGLSINDWRAMRGMWAPTLAMSTLHLGAWAVCASLREDRTAPVDRAIAPYRARAFRQRTDDVGVAGPNADGLATDDNPAHIPAELAHGVGEENATLQARHDDLRTRQAAIRERLEARMQKLQQVHNALIAAVMANAVGLRVGVNHQAESWAYSALNPR